MGDRSTRAGLPAPDAGSAGSSPAPVPAQRPPRKGEGVVALPGPGLARTQHLPAELLAVMDGKLADAVANAADYAGKAIAPATRCRLQGRLERFLPMGTAEQGRSDGAAGASGGGRGLAGDARRALGRSALRRRIAAIAWHHRSLGHAWQAGHAAIRQTLTGIGREHRRPVRPAAALISADVKQLIAVCPATWPGPRASRACATGRCFWSVSPAPSGARSWSASTSPICGSRQRA